MAVLTGAGLSGFRPLNGDSFCKRSMTMQKNLQKCFRPLNGDSFCKQYTWWIVPQYSLCFRPLIGDSFCKPSQSHSICLRWNLFKVSVPLSGIAFVNLKINKKDVKEWFVSVPLSGIAFVNSQWISYYFYISIVSVPLSGIAFVNILMYTLHHRQLLLFPSPYRG